jgi:hypothetical protein
MLKLVQMGSGTTKYNMTSDFRQMPIKAENCNEVVSKTNKILLQHFYCFFSQFIRSVYLTSSLLPEIQQITS